ncbi:hypothetical protein DBV15_06776 [Temnothorax longispinosus]|uniref:Uncharacterized protein n=1 Tax=Temnothorax longispinosus TaxID=300112 RepID=A0A4S2KXW4_9HYME|nr:hypothetical protein DBV15_06776 [Temnothorax longispinosus]
MGTAREAISPRTDSHESKMHSRATDEVSIYVTSHLNAARFIPRYLKGEHETRNYNLVRIRMIEFTEIIAISSEMRRSPQSCDYFLSHSSPRIPTRGLPSSPARGGRVTTVRPLCDRLAHDTTDTDGETSDVYAPLAAHSSHRVCEVVSLDIFVEFLCFTSRSSIPSTLAKHARARLGATAVAKTAKQQTFIEHVSKEIRTRLEYLSPYLRQCVCARATARTSQLCARSAELTILEEEGEAETRVERRAHRIATRYKDKPEPDGAAAVSAVSASEIDMEIKERARRKNGGGRRRSKRRGERGPRGVKGVGSVALRSHAFRSVMAAAGRSDAPRPSSSCAHAHTAARRRAPAGRPASLPSLKEKKSDRGRRRGNDRALSSVRTRCLLDIRGHESPRNIGTPRSFVPRSLRGYLSTRTEKGKETQGRAESTTGLRRVEEEGERRGAPTALNAPRRRRPLSRCSGPLAPRAPRALLYGDVNKARTVAPKRYVCTYITRFLHEAERGDDVILIAYCLIPSKKAFSALILRQGAAAPYLLPRESLVRGDSITPLSDSSPLQAWMENSLGLPTSVIHLSPAKGFQSLSDLVFGSHRRRGTRNTEVGILRRSVRRRHSTGRRGRRALPAEQARTNVRGNKALRGEESWDFMRDKGALSRRLPSRVGRTRAASKFTKITPVSIPGARTEERRERQAGTRLREASAKKMHGNNIQECDEHDKRNTAESSSPPRARTHALTSAGFSFASAPKMERNGYARITYTRCARSSFSSAVEYGTHCRARGEREGGKRTGRGTDEKGGGEEGRQIVLWEHTRPNTCVSLPVAGRNVTVRYEGPLECLLSSMARRNGIRVSGQKPRRVFSSSALPLLALGAAVTTYAAFILASSTRGAGFLDPPGADATDTQYIPLKHAARFRRARTGYERRPTFVTRMTPASRYPIVSARTADKSDTQLVLALPEKFSKNYTNVRVQFDCASSFVLYPGDDIADHDSFVSFSLRAQCEWPRGRKEVKRKEEVTREATCLRAHQPRHRSHQSTTQRTRTTARATLRMIACASRSRQCADARCALASTHDAAKATRKQQASGQAGSADAGAMHVRGGVGVREDGRSRGEDMRCVAASGVEEDCGGKGADPLVLRSGLPPNRAATAPPVSVCFGPAGTDTPLSLSLFHVARTRGLKEDIVLALFSPKPRKRIPNLVPFRSVRVFRHPIALTLTPRRRDTFDNTHGRSKKTGGFINGSSTRTCERASARAMLVHSIARARVNDRNAYTVYTREAPTTWGRKIAPRNETMGTRQRQSYLVLDMRTWTSDDKLSSSCLPSSARYAKAETGLLTLEYLTPRVAPYEI